MANEFNNTAAVNPNNPQNNGRPEDLNSFFDESANSGFKFKDLVFLILRNLPWFLIFSAIGGLIAFYKVRGQERIYASSSTLLIKTLGSSGSESMRGSSTLNAIQGPGIFVSTVDNEIMVMKSQTNMENMVRALNLNVMYSFKTKMARRNTDLYKDAPITVEFLGMDEQASAAFSVRPIDEEYVMLDDFGGSIPETKVKLNDTVITPVGKIIVKPTWRYGEFNNIAIVVRHLPVSAVGSMYRGRIAVTRANQKNSILRLSLSDTSPTRAADVLNTLMDVYNKESIDDQQRVLDYTEKFINDRIEFLMNDIQEYQQVSVDFMRSHNIIDTRSYGQTYVATSTAMTAEAKQLEQQADMVRYLLEFVRNNQDQMIPVGVVSISSDATSVIAKYNDNQVKIEKYKADGTINNPMAQSLIEEQVGLHASIVTVLETNLVSLQERIDAANRERNIANSQIQSVPLAQLQLNDVARQQGIKESLYLQLLTKREELLMMSPQLEATGKVIDYAYANPTPISPDERKSTLIGILIGLAIPVAFLLLRNMLDTTIHDRVDIQKSCNVPFLGDVPYESDIEEHAIMVKENGRDSLSESFRLIRSSLEYMKDRRDGAHVIMFTSFMVSSGKTFISTNLATSFALAKRKTIIVDLDIRKGTLFRVYGVNTRAGVSNYLSGKTDSIDDIIHSSPTSNGPDIIFSGPVPPNPAELLMSTRLEDLIAELRTRYEYIFLDNVPVGMVADADIVKRVADTTIMVLRAGKTDKRLLFDVEKFYKDGAFPNLCVVLNSVNKRKRGYGYYGYGYGYGYGDEESEKERKKRKKWYYRLFHRHHHHGSKKHHSGKLTNNDDGKE